MVSTGSTPYEAVRNFLAPTQRLLSCISQQRVNLAAVAAGVSPYHPTTEPHSMLLALGEPVRLRGYPATAMLVRRRFRIIEVSRQPGIWRVIVSAYEYALYEREQLEIFAYHWHPGAPGNVEYPHLHVRGDTVGKAHFPTGHISLSRVVRLAIEAFGVAALRSDWREVLAGAEAEAFS